MLNQVTTPYDPAAQTKSAHPVSLRTPWQSPLPLVFIVAVERLLTLCPCGRPVFSLGVAVGSFLRFAVFITNQAWPRSHSILCDPSRAARACGACVLPRVGNVFGNNYQILPCLRFLLFLLGFQIRSTLECLSLD